MSGPADSLILRIIDDLEARIMSEVSDRIDEVSSSFDAAHERVMAAVKALRDEIEAVRANNPTPDDLAKLSQLDSKIDALDPGKPTVLPEQPDGSVESGPLPL